MSGHLQGRFAASRALHSALRAVPWPAVLADRPDNKWIVAERMCFGEQPLSTSPEKANLAAVLLPLIRDADDAPKQLIHCDLHGNLLFHESLPPTVIDFTPYYRPASFSDSVHAADLLLWGNVPLDELKQYVSRPNMARGLLFRLLAEGDAFVERRVRDLYEATIAELINDKGSGSS